MKSLRTETGDVQDPLRKIFSPLKIAGPWQRLCAQAIDLGTVSLCTTWAMVIWFPDRIFSGHWWVALITLSIYVSLFTQIIFLYAYGNTLGKKLMNLKIQSARPKQSVTTVQIIQRCLSWWAGIFSFGTTWTTIFSLNDRRAWHDLVSETVVVNKENVASHPTRIQKNISIVWMCASFVAFVMILMFTLLYQFRALRSGQLTISDDAAKVQKERASWYLLGGITAPVANNGPLGGFMKSFRQARDLSPARRQDFYKSNMEAQENNLCRAGQELSTSCQTAQALSQLLNNSMIKNLHPHALEGVRILEKVEAQNRVTDQISVLENEAVKWNKTSFEYSVLRQTQAHIMMKAGSFEEAKKILAAITETAPTLLTASLNENLCQSEALTDCRFRTVSACLQNPYWQAWSSGCNAQTEPRDYTLSAEILGYWWGQAHSRSSHFENLSSWQKVKERYASSGPNFTGQNFESYVISALDFVLNIKTSNPDDLIGKSKNLGLENPLWGWAQSEALREFGEQWTFLIHPSEKNLISRYNLLEKTNTTMVAGRKKAHSVTEASSTATGPQGAVDSHHSAGARTQESR